MRWSDLSWLPVAAAALLQAGCETAGPSEPATLTEAATLILATKPSASAPSRAPFATQPVVQLQDAAGKAVALAGVVITASTAAGSGTLGGTATATTRFCPLALR